MISNFFDIAMLDFFNVLSINFNFHDLKFVVNF